MEKGKGRKRGLTTGERLGGNEDRETLKSFHPVQLSVILLFDELVSGSGRGREGLL